MARKRFTERQVIETLIRTGHEIRDYRTKEVITLETVKELEREHVIALALGGADDPTNCAYSRSANHKMQTNGKPHNRVGSDKHAIFKIKRLRGEVGNGPKKKIPSRPFPKQHQPFRRDYTPREKEVSE